MASPNLVALFRLVIHRSYTGNRSAWLAQDQSEWFPDKKEPVDCPRCRFRFQCLFADRPLASMVSFAFSEAPARISSPVIGNSKIAPRAFYWSPLILQYQTVKILPQTCRIKDR